MLSFRGGNSFQIKHLEELNKVSENIFLFLKLCVESIFSLTLLKPLKNVTECQDFCKLTKFNITFGKTYTTKERMLNGTRENYREDK